MRSNRYFFFAMAMAISGSAFAQDTFDFTSESINSNQALSDATNEHRTRTAGSTYLFGNTISIVSGTLNSVISGTFASEARVQLKNNTTGKTGQIQFTNTGSFTNPFNLTPGNAFGLTGNVVGSQVTTGDTWDLEFYESFNDGAGPDATWTNLKFLSTVFVPPPPPPATDLGVMYDTHSTYANPDFTASSIGGAVKWYKINLLNPINNGAGTFLDIDTEGSALSDTEIAIYDSLGNKIAEDDDDGSGLLSELSFGQTAPLRTIGTAVGGNGRDGALAAGTYYIAAAGFNATFNGGFNATTTSTNTTSELRLNIRTNVVPEPASIAAMGLGVAAFLFRRRRSK